MRDQLKGIICATVGLSAAGPVLGEEQLFKDPITGCGITIDAGADDVIDLVSWSGRCNDGKAEGAGVGLVVANGGLAVRYDGVMSGGKMNGPGLLIYSVDEQYVKIFGTFVDGLPRGEARVSWPNGNEFYGTLDGSLDSGEGVYVDKDGGFLIGAFDDGAITGDVFYATDDEEVFFGAFENSEPREGTITYPNGNRYDGTFADGEPSGKGVLTIAGQGVYFGAFADGLPNGEGMLVDSDGTVYRGTFLDGYAEGEVNVTQADGTTSQQTWKDGEKVK